MNRIAIAIIVSVAVIGTILAGTYLTVTITFTAVV
jgi:hypothetical protein